MSAVRQREDISKLAIAVTITDTEKPDNQKTVTLTRKVAFVGRAFINAGRRGITRKDFASFHIAHYVQMMREAGLTISTDMEDNSASWGGKHARYKLLGDVTYSVVPIPKPKKRKPATAAAKQVFNPNTSNGQLEGLSE